MSNPYRQVARLALIPDGDAGTRVTLKAMANFIRHRRFYPAIRRLAESIIANVPEKNAFAEASAIHAWVRDNIRYTPDVANVETLQDPLLLLETRQGDCDDKSMLFAALAQSVGMDVVFIAVAFGGQFEHVLPAVLIDGEWVAAETTENVPLGWVPENITREMRVTV